MSEGETRLWKWTELPRFATFCRQISETIGVPYEDAFDQIRWSIEEDICRNPITVSHLDPRFDDDRRRVFRTYYAPGLTPTPPLVVAFRVVRYPEFGREGVIEGREVWLEEELRQIGYSLDAEAS